MRDVAVFLAAAMISITAPSYAQTVHEKTTFFAVHGSTLGELEADMDRQGPYVSGTGARHPGAIEISFDGNVSYKRASGGGCAVADPDIVLNLNIILPKWQMPASASDATRTIWSVLQNDIRTHEKHHAAIARTWQKKIASALRNLRPEPTCGQMKAVVEATTTRYLAGHEAAQLNFDRIEGDVVNRRVRREIRKTIGSLH